MNEACNQARVEDCGLNIPRIREVCKIDGKWAIATEYVEGVTLQKLMDENLDDDERKATQYYNMYETELGLLLQYTNKPRMRVVESAWGCF